jgi:hypothetical protein
MARQLSLATLLLAVTLAAASTAQEALSPLARSIQDDLNLLDSRVSTRSDERLQSDRIQRTARERGRAARLFAPAPQPSARDIALGSALGAAQQDLRTLKTREPNAEATPILERQLDRVSREAGTLYPPSRDPAALYAR